MAEIIQIYPSNATDLEGCNRLLMETENGITSKKKVSIPIAELTELGTGVASLLPVFRTITQTTTMHVDGLYRVANATVGDTLKIAKNGNFWGAFKTAEGSSKFAQLQTAGSVPTTTKTVMPVNPATIMMAVALYSIEQKLGNIVELEKQILSFLEVEKEAEIEADMQTLTSLLKKYKLSWDNEHFIASNHKLVIDIQRTARKNILAYQKQIAEILNIKKLLVFQTKVEDTLRDLLRKFRYYRMSIYGFALSSLVEILLSGDFKEANIENTKEEIGAHALAYRDLYSSSSFFMEKMSNASVKANVMNGIGIVGKATGKLIEKIPVVKEGSVDEYLQGSSEQLQIRSDDLKKKAVKAFAEISDPKVAIFTEQMDDLIQIYCHTKEIYFDRENIHLVAG